MREHDAPPAYPSAYLQPIALIHAIFDLRIYMTGRLEQEPDGPVARFVETAPWGLLCLLNGAAPLTTTRRRRRKMLPTCRRATRASAAVLHARHEAPDTSLRSLPCGASRRPQRS